MRYDWRHILSWTEILCFVLVWSVGIATMVVQLYARQGKAEAADVAAADSPAPGAVLLD